MQLAAFEVAHRLGLSTVCADPNPDAACRSLADAFYCCDLLDMQALEHIAANEGIDAVLTLAADYPLPAASLLCEKFGLAGPSPTAVSTVCNKASLRKNTEAHFISSPRWEQIECVTAASSSQLLEQCPCVVKPVDSSGGRGVTFVSVEAGKDVLENAVRTAIATSKSGRAIVEEFIDGVEFSVESITFNGKTKIVAITDKLTSGPPFFVEIGHAVPATLSSEEIDTIINFVADVTAATGIDNCASHIELKLTPHGPVLIEVAARLGGGFINTDLVPLALGVDMVRAAIDVALGYPPILESTRLLGAAIRFLLPSPGILDAVMGFGELGRDARVHRAVCRYQPGERVPLIRDATGRKAYIISVSATSAEASLVAGEAAAQVIFRMRS